MQMADEALASTLLEFVSKARACGTFWAFTQCPEWSTPRTNWSKLNSFKWTSNIPRTNWLKLSSFKWTSNTLRTKWSKLSILQVNLQHTTYQLIQLSSFKWTSSTSRTNWSKLISFEWNSNAQRTNWSNVIKISSFKWTSTDTGESGRVDFTHYRGHYQTLNSPYSCITC